MTAFFTTFYDPPMAWDRDVWYNKQQDELNYKYLMR